MLMALGPWLMVFGFGHWFMVLVLGPWCMGCVMVEIETSQRIEGSCLQDAFRNLFPILLGVTFWSFLGPPNDTMPILTCVGALVSCLVGSILAVCKGARAGKPWESKKQCRSDLSIKHKLFAKRNKPKP